MIVSRVFAMARPRRPHAECDLVCAAAKELPAGSASSQAAIIARRVAAAANAAIDGEPGDRLAVLLGALAQSPIELLAQDAEIDTGSLIRSERVRRFEERGCNHLAECDWPGEAREVVAAVSAKLAKRYARHLAKK